MPRFILVFLLLAESSHANLLSRCRDKICSTLQKCVAVLTQKSVPPAPQSVEEINETKEVESTLVGLPAAVEFRSDNILSIDAPPEVFNPGQFVSVASVELSSGRLTNQPLLKPFVMLTAHDYESLGPTRLSADLAHDLQHISGEFTPNRQIYTIRAYVAPRIRHLPFRGLAIGEKFFVLSSDDPLTDELEGRFSARWFGKYHPHQQHRVVQTSVYEESLHGIWKVENDFLVLRMLDQPRLVR